MALKLKMDVEIPDSVLEGILITAFDAHYGGSNFWIEFEGIDKTKDDQWRAIRFTDIHTKKKHTVSWMTIAAGMQRILDLPVDTLTKFKERIGEAVMNDDDGGLDANDADTIVQYGLFGNEIHS